jgi:hypothetical protein
LLAREEFGAMSVQDGQQLVILDILKPALDLVFA